MSKKMKLPFIFKSIETSTPSSQWPWITCKNPKTLSFRVDNGMFKTMNSAYVSTTFDSESFSSSASEAAIDESAIDEASPIDESECIEVVIKGLRSSERLFFELGAETSSILEEAKGVDNESFFLITSEAEAGRIASTDDNESRMFKESVTMAMDSADPFHDFRKSMEEMVEAHGLMKDWDFLEELLTCYLKVNAESNHGYIIEAFVDLLIGIEFANSFASTKSLSSDEDRCCSSSVNHSFTSPLSFYSSTLSTSPCLSSLEAEDEIENSVTNVLSLLSSNVE